MDGALPAGGRGAAGGGRGGEGAWGPPTAARGACSFAVGPSLPGGAARLPGALRLGAGPAAGRAGCRDLGGTSMVRRCCAAVLVRALRSIACPLDWSGFMGVVRGAARRAVGRSSETSDTTVFLASRAARCSA